MQIPPHVPDHDGLNLADEFGPSKREAMSAKMREGKDRPEWATSTKMAVWHRMQAMRLAFRADIDDCFRCYLCFECGVLTDAEIDHFYPWSSILAQLNKAAKDPKLQAQFPDGGKDFFVNGLPTAWAGVYYSNDLHNLILIHGGKGHACNQSKSKLTPDVAVERNVYSHLGNSGPALTYLGVPQLAKKAAEADQPMAIMLAGVKASAQLWDKLLVANEKHIESRAHARRHVAEEAGIFLGTVPLEVPVTHAPGARLPGTNRKPSAPQALAMQHGNLGASPGARRLSFSDDMGDAMLVPRLQARLRDDSFKVPLPPRPSGHDASANTPLGSGGVKRDRKADEIDNSIVPPPPGSPPLRFRASDKPPKLQRPDQPDGSTGL
jgi:hypothetical protein